MNIFAYLIVIGILVLVHETGHFLGARLVGVRVEKFSLGFGRKIFSFRRGQTEYSVNMVPLGGYVKLAGDNLEEFHQQPDEYLSQSPLKRLVVVLLGPIFNYIFAFLCLWFVFWRGYPAMLPQVGDVLDGFGAKEAGMMKDDKIVAIDEKKIDYWEDIQRYMRQKQGDSVKVTFLRGGERLSVVVNLKASPQDRQSPFFRRAPRKILGIVPAGEFVFIKKPFWEAGALSFLKINASVVVTYQMIWSMLTGAVSVKDTVSGPLGIFMVTKEVVKLGILPFLHFMAVLSLSLTVFNLLPLPILDGGHVIFLILEKIRGRPVSVEVERWAIRVGLVVMSVLFILATYNDILNFWGERLVKLFSK